MENKQSLEFIKSLLNGEKVKCPKCNKGVLISDAEPSQSHFFIAQVLVHGGLESFSPSKPLANYKRDEIVWYRLEKSTEYYSEKYTVFGHTPTQLVDDSKENIVMPKIWHGNKWADIGCGCGYKNGRLGCLCLDNMEEIYV